MTQAIILAGGFGTRLRSVVKDVPKPMALIHERPFLSYLLEEIWRQGIIKQVILSVHYKYEVIAAYFGDTYKDLSLQYVIEEEPLGTGGAIKNCSHLISSNREIFVLNGDSFLKLSYEEMLRFHRDCQSLVTLAVKKMPSCHRYGRVLLNQTNQILSFEAQGSTQEGYINAGIYLLAPQVFETFPEAPFSFERDFLPSYLTQIMPKGYVSPGYFIDIGIPEDYKQAMQSLTHVAF